MTAHAGLQAFYLPAPSGGRFCLFHAPQGEHALGRVLYAHPFAEEMNKSRRMAALQSRALAVAGFAVLQIDLFGCGDSSGTSGDATWEGWVDDLVVAHDWLQAHAAGPSWFWGLRAGCLLAAQAAGRVDEPRNYLFWQPANAGKLLVQQFLRLKAANELLSGEGKGVVNELRQRLDSGARIEVAGYELSPALVRGFEAATLSHSGQKHLPGRVEWIEISSQPDAALSPAATASAERWRAAGHVVEAQVVAGPAFWQTTEIEEAPLLIQATVAALRRDVKPAVSASHDAP